MMIFPFEIQYSLFDILRLKKVAPKPEPAIAVHAATCSNKLSNPSSYFVSLPFCFSLSSVTQ
jgi:hypothetical protein